MFTFFERDTSFKFNQASTGRLSAPPWVAIGTLMTAVEKNLECTCHWTREAGDALMIDHEAAGDFLHFAKRYAREAVILIERLCAAHDVIPTDE